MTDALAVLFLTAWYPTARNPGAGVFVREQARAVAGYDRVAVLHCAGLASELPQPWLFEVERDPTLTAGLPVYRVQHRRLPVLGSSYGLYLWSVWQAVRRIRRSGFRPDVIHAHTYGAGLPGLLVARAMGVPCVVTEHFSAFMTGTIGRRALTQARWIFRRADRVIAVSRALQVALERQKVRARFTVIPNVVDTALFHPRLCTTAERGPRRIVFAGSLVPIKGISYLVSAAARLAGVRDDWRLDIVGDGPQRAEYEAQAAGLGLGDRVAFHGFRPPTELAEMVRAADCLVLASLTETFSVAVAEALCAGTPVVATQCGGPEELVNAENGILVPAGDAGALAEGLAAMLARAPHYDRPRIATQAAARFGPEQIGGRLDELYRQVIADRHGGPPSRRQPGRK